MLVTMTVVGFAVVLHRFNSDQARPRTRQGTDHPLEIVVYADVVSVDAAAHNMTIRLSFAPQGDLIDQTHRLKQPVDVTSPSVATGSIKDVTGNEEVIYNVGSTMNAFDRTIPLTRLGSSDTNTANQVTSYPYDHYNTDFQVFVLTGDPNPADRKPIPSKLDFVYSAHGFTITATPTKPDPSTATTFSGQQVSSTDLLHDYELHVRRASSTVFFAVFLIVLMWLLTIAIVAMAVILTFLHHDIGPGVLGFLAAILFAFPGMRGVLPGAPPLGSLNDFLGFFWCEAIVAITLLLLAVLFLTREARSRRSWATGISDLPFEKRADRLAQLQALVEMRDEGVVSAEEFETERKRILSGPGSAPSSPASSANSRAT
jgi:uncharacterized protein DUF4436